MTETYAGGCPTCHEHRDDATIPGHCCACAELTLYVTGGLCAEHRPDGTDTPVPVVHRDGHTIRVTIRREAVELAVECPFDGADMPAGDIPQCRLMGGGEHEECNVRLFLTSNDTADVFLEYGDEGFTVDRSPFRIEYWWDSGDECYLWRPEESQSVLLMLAGKFFDAEIAPGHMASGVPADAIASMRRRHGRDCMASPAARMDLAEWAATRGVGGDQ